MRRRRCAIVLFSASVTSEHLYFQTASHSLRKAIFCLLKKDSLLACINERCWAGGRERGREKEGARPSEEKWKGADTGVVKWIGIEKIFF